MRTQTRKWCVYMVSCSDNSLYTGITTDIERRMQQHNSDKGGARYTRSRRPVTLTYLEYTDSRSKAAKREYHIKQLSVEQKRSLIVAYTESLSS